MSVCAVQARWARSRRRIDAALIREHWDDMCRVAGTLHTKAAVASEVIQALQRGGRPTTLARALAEVGRISRTIAILDYVTNPAQRRRILVQLNRQETRHQLARDVFHGRRGHLYQALPTGPGATASVASGSSPTCSRFGTAGTWTTPSSTYGAKGPPSPRISNISRPLSTSRSISTAAMSSLLRSISATADFVHRSPLHDGSGPGSRHPP
ncbi:MAG: transposase [Actinobacteria bacterium]|nr:transposase [Actinomycetota bacterium]